MRSFCRQWENYRDNAQEYRTLWVHYGLLKDMKPWNDMSLKINNSVTGDSPSAIQNGAIFFSCLNIFLFNKMLLNMLSFLNERVPDALICLFVIWILQPIAELLYRFYALYSLQMRGKYFWNGWLKEVFKEKLADQLCPWLKEQIYTWPLVISYVDSLHLHSGFHSHVIKY